MIGQLLVFLVLLIIAVIVSVIDMNAKLKQIAYIIVGIAALLILLPLVGINVPLN